MIWEYPLFLTSHLIAFDWQKMRTETNITKTVALAPQIEAKDKQSILSDTSFFKKLDSANRDELSKIINTIQTLMNKKEYTPERVKDLSLHLARNSLILQRDCEEIIQSIATLAKHRRHYFFEKEGIKTHFFGNINKTNSIQMLENKLSLAHHNAIVSFPEKNPNPSDSNQESADLHKDQEDQKTKKPMYSTSLQLRISQFEKTKSRPSDLPQLHFLQQINTRLHVLSQNDPSYSGRDDQKKEHLTQIKNTLWDLVEEQEKAALETAFYVFLQTRIDWSLFNKDLNQNPYHPDDADNREKSRSCKSTPPISTPFESTHMAAPLTRRHSCFF